MSGSSPGKPSRAEARRALAEVARTRNWEVADRFSQRLAGWLGRRHLPLHAGLCLAPCRAIHTFGMRVAIDVVFIDRRLRVVRCVARLTPWRMVACAHAFAVIELAAGGAARAGLAPGVRLEPTAVAASPPPLLPPSPPLPPPPARPPATLQPQPSLSPQRHRT